MVGSGLCQFCLQCLLEETGGVWKCWVEWVKGVGIVELHGALRCGAEEDDMGHHDHHQLGLWFQSAKFLLQRLPDSELTKCGFWFGQRCCVPFWTFKQDARRLHKSLLQHDDLTFPQLFIVCLPVNMALYVPLVLSCEFERSSRSRSTDIRGSKAWLSAQNAAEQLKSNSTDSSCGMKIGHLIVHKQSSTYHDK